jgi:peptide/nickel transport system permease protein
MLAYVLRRLLYVAPIAIGVSMVCFMLVHLAPGDPLAAMLPDNTPPEVAAAVRAAYGFDKPLPLQYLHWLAHVATGDFGLSIATRRPVLMEVGPAIVNTMKLAGGAILIGGALGVLFGACAAWRSGSKADKAISAVGILGISVPQYWLGMVLVVIFAVDLGVLPATGMGDPKTASLGQFFSHAILPTLTLAVVPIGIIAKSVRSSVAEVLRQDYVQALRAKGLPARRIFLHVARNAAPPVLAVMGLQFAHLLGGSILVETVFSWPGTGYLMNASIFMRDLPVLQGTILVLAMFFILINLLVDILQMAFDPRLRGARLAGKEAS